MAIPGLAITGVGAITPVGLKALPAAAAIRAGIARLGALPEVFDGQGEPVVGGRVPVPDVDGDDRLGRWLRLATLEALDSANFAPRKDPPAIGVVLAVAPPSRPDRRDQEAPARLSALEAALKERARVTQREVVAAGHAAGFLALAKAAALLDSAGCAAVIVAAADTLLDVRVLEWLDGNERLKARYAPGGFLPGEAAAAFIVEKAAQVDRPGKTVWALCHPVASAVEKVGREADEPNLGAGLTEALQGALDRAEIGPRDVEVVLCDLNGEPYRANEWCLARNRVLGRAGAIDLWHPADAMGDVGAASGGLLAVLAGVGFTRGFWRCRRLLLWTSSDDGARAAVCLEHPLAAAAAR